MAIRVGINGFGRIGRLVFRAAAANSDIEIVHVNDLFDTKSLVHLLKYDTVHGKYKHDLNLDGETLHTLHHKVTFSAIKNVAELPWKDKGVDVVVESTGVFRGRKTDKKAGYDTHLAAGAKKVVLTVPAKDAIDATIVLGVNDEALKPEHHCVSNASCTTNCVAPLAKVLHDNFKIKRGLMTTVHAYTNDQRIADLAHDDLRRARAAAQNIIPTTTGAAKAVGLVIPDLKGKLDGTAIRVPVPDGSITDLTVELEKETSVEEVNAAYKAAAAAANFKGILEYSDEELVSSDIIGNPHSCIFDSQSTMVMGNIAKVFGWYDNEWGYSCRVVDLVKRVAAHA